MLKGNEKFDLDELKKLHADLVKQLAEIEEAVFASGSSVDDSIAEGKDGCVAVVDLSPLSDRVEAAYDAIGILDQLRIKYPDENLVIDLLMLVSESLGVDITTA